MDACEDSDLANCLMDYPTIKQEDAHYLGHPSSHTTVRTVRYTAFSQLTQHVQTDSRSQPSHNDGIGSFFKSLAEQGESGVTAGRGAKRRGLRLRPSPAQSPA